MSYASDGQAILNDSGYEDWIVEDDSVIVCPHGHSIEYDGQCPEGCVSPFREMGLI